MKTVPLGDVVSFTNGGTPTRSRAEFWDGEIPWITGADITDEGTVSARSHISESAVKGSSTNILPAGTVLLLTRTSVGKVAVLPEPMAINQDITGITPSAGVDARYLIHFLKASKPTLLKHLRGATIKGISRDDVASLEFAFTSLPEQRRIAAILDHADALRAKHRQVLAHLDSLTQATFHDMFGAPGDSRWERVPLGEVIRQIDSGTSPNCDARPADDEEWGVLKLGAVTYGVFRPSENKAYTHDIGSMNSNEVRSGDVLMTRKNTRELVGAVAVVGDVRPRLLLPDLIFRLHIDTTRVDRRYFQAMMMNPLKRPEVRDLSSGSSASMPNISKARLVKLPLELPPLRLQQAFATQSEHIDAQRVVIERALAADDELFASLQSRAFRGEL